MPSSEPRRFGRTFLRRFVLAGGIAIAFAILAANCSAGESAKGKSKSGDKPIAEPESELVESPALPYLTLMIARDPALHRELKLSRREVERVAAAVAEVDGSMWRLRDVPVARCRAELDKLVAQLRAGLEKTLSTEQLARMDEVILQARGFKGLLSEDLAKRLAISAEQSKQLRQAIAEASRSATTPAPRDERATAQSVLEVLTSDQTAQWSSSLGKPFDLSKIRQIGCVAPELCNVEAWINSEPLTLASQRGKVVAVHFWAFGCINCVRNLPHYQAWFDSFPSSKLTIVGIHTPETDHEKSVDNLRASVSERGIKYPVAVDGAAENWKAWANHLWPSVYLVDKRGQVRNWWYGELNWQGAGGEAFMRKRIEALIAED